MAKSRSEKRWVRFGRKKVRELELDDGKVKSRESVEDSCGTEKIEFCKAHRPKGIVGMMVIAEGGSFTQQASLSYLPPWPYVRLRWQPYSPFMMHHSPFVLTP